MIGRVLGNRYEVLEKVGGGGMAIVYKAKCHLLNRFVAIKILRAEFTNDQEFIDKFKRESQSAASLSHQNIVNIYDVGSEDEIYYIVMEYIKGKTLKQLIREKGKLSLNESIDVATQIAEALNHAHKNQIVHRDIKPHNIMVGDDGKIKVTDFGIARAATTSTVTNTSNVIGSVHYFSPEQARGGFTDAKSDIYSLGIVMYEMLTGQVPFQGESPISVALKHIQEDIIPPTELNASIPKNIENIIRKAVEKDQSLRYNNAQELLDDLHKVQKFDHEDLIELKNFNDAKTQVIPIVKDEMLKVNNTKEGIQSKKGRDQKTKAKKSSKFSTLLAILLAFIVTSSAAVGYVLFSDILKVKEVIVPNLVGMSEEDARREVEGLGLEFEVDNRRYSEDFKEGYIIKQYNVADQPVKINSTVRVVVSLGLKYVEVPDVLGKTINEAMITLDQNGLKEGEVTYEFSDLYPKDTIMKQEPKADERVQENTKVDYVISNGPELEYMTMPNLIGLTLEAAKREVIANTFVVGKIDEVPDNDIPEGLVTWQSYNAGDQLKESTVIDLKVSSGPEPTQEDTDDQVNSDNENTDKDTGASEKETAKQLLIRLPNDREKVEVKIYKVQDDIKVLEYNKTHLTSEEGIKVTVSGKGVVKFIIYFDGELKEEKEFQF